MEKNILKERKIPLLSRNQCRYTHKTSLTLDRGICRILKQRKYMGNMNFFGLSH